MTTFSVVSWNIQAGRGVDGQTDPVRIGSVLRLADAADIICLQEVARNMPRLTGGVSFDEPALLGAIFEGFHAVFRPAVERFDPHSGEWSAFGAMILSRFPIVGVRNHLLPRPFLGEAISMQRQLLEAVVLAPTGALSVATTHLEFHLAEHRLAQVAHIRALCAATLDRAAVAGRPAEGEAADTRGLSGIAPDLSGSAYDERPPVRDALVCGDFNFTPESAEYRAMVAPRETGKGLFADAWCLAHADRPHAPTCGLGDHEQWPQGSHCRDYAFVTPGLAGQVENLVVNAQTRASDHQPLQLELRGRP